MKASSTAQEEFIKTLLRKGEKRKSILTKFVKKFEVGSVRTFDRRLKSAEESISKEQKSIQSKVEEKAASEISERVAQILTEVERQNLLTEIALGKIEIPIKKPQWDHAQKKFIFIPMMEVPDHSTRIRAIAELNKMDGAYAPTKQQITLTEDKPILSTNPLADGNNSAQ